MINHCGHTVHIIPILVVILILWNTDIINSDSNTISNTDIINTDIINTDSKINSNTISIEILVVNNINTDVIWKLLLFPTGSHEISVAPQLPAKHRVVVSIPYWWWNLAIRIEHVCYYDENIWKSYM